MASRLAALVSLGLLATVLGADIRRPPTISKGPTDGGRVKLFRSGEDVTIPCEASGSPDPTYIWLKNGVKIDFNTERIEKLASYGSIRIAQASLIHEGYFQCIADNMYGKAMSDVLLFKRTFQSSVKKQEPRIITVKEGEGAVVACEPAEGYPEPVYSWQTGANSEAKIWRALALNDRVSIDEKGNLHFANVIPGDAQEGRIYKCNIFNNQVDVTTGGSYTQVTVTPDPNAPNKVPTLSFKTGANLVAIEGESINITCIFNGRPAPTSSWQKVGGYLPGGRYEFLDYNRVLMIKRVEPSDAGTYRCTSSNKAGSGSEDIKITVQSRPQFTKSLANVNATQGKSISFLCQTKATPSSEVKWYKNGEEVRRDYLPERWFLSNMDANLTIVKLQKDNPNDPQAGGDLMNIQCNASNANGYVFADAYLNVLLPVVLMEIPQNQTLANNTELIILRCNATADPSTPVEIDWLKNGGYISYNEVYYQNQEGHLVLDVKKARERNFAAKYTCIASNGYDERRAIAYVTDPYPVVATAGLWWWWIIVLIVLILLLIIIILLCCYCCQRNREFGYPVDQKERAWGHDPEKELLELGFQDYHRSEEDLKKRSRPDVTDDDQVPEDRRPIYKGDKKLKPPPSQRFESDA